MPTNDRETGVHPEELLGPFALHALDDQEAAQVEAHLDICPQCRQSAAQLQLTATLLGQAVAQRTPPPSLRSRVMEALPLASPSRRDAGRVTAVAYSVVKPARLMAAVAAAVALALFGLSLAMNLGLADRMDRMEQESSEFITRLGQENATLTARLGQLEQENSILRTSLYHAEAEDAQVMSGLRQLQTASYWLADPNTHPVTLEPPRGISGSHGILLVTRDGRRAILMVAVTGGLSTSSASASSTYRVWLVRQGYRVSVGQFKVDSAGWGTMSLYLSEPLYRFDRLELTADRAMGGNTEPEQMVLWAKITPPGPAEPSPPPW